MDRTTPARRKRRGKKGGDETTLLPGPVPNPENCGRIANKATLQTKERKKKKRANQRQLPLVNTMLGCKQARKSCQKLNQKRELKTRRQKTRKWSQKL